MVFALLIPLMHWTTILMQDIMILYGTMLNFLSPEIIILKLMLMMHVIFTLIISLTNNNQYVKKVLFQIQIPLLVKPLKLYFLIKESIEFLLTFIKNLVEDFLLILLVEPRVVN